MKTNVLKNEGKELILEFEGTDSTIAEMLASQLLTEADVSFAGVSRDHPQTGKPTLVIKTSKKKPADALQSAIEALEESFTELMKGIPKK
jgi:DNA-directed RNA polymerase subunit L